jgi:hypothetical protein
MSGDRVQVDIILDPKGRPPALLLEGTDASDGSSSPTPTFGQAFAVTRRADSYF